MAPNWIVLMAVAAISHAGWNFYLKQSENKTVFLWSLRLWALVIFLPVGLVLQAGHPLDVQWFPWGAASATLHCLYSLLLIKAYERTELAMAYPIARGTAPLIVVIIGWTTLGELMRPATAFGAVLVVTGVLLLYVVPRSGRTGSLLAAMLRSPWPIAVGLCIAGYSILDKLAVGHVPPVALNVMQNIGQVSVLGLVTLRRVGANAIRVQWRRHWPKMAFSGLMVGLAYVLVLVVMKDTPVSRVAPVRESSILFGAILGFVFLKEEFSLRKILGASLIFLGVVAAAM